MFGACFLIAITSVGQVGLDSSIPLNSDGINRIGSALGRTFKTSIDPTGLQKSPSWLMDTANPPLSAKRAVDLAAAAALQLQQGNEKWNADLKGMRRELARLVLVPSFLANKWYWWVDFRYEVPNINRAGPPTEIFFAVLMDETVIVPTFGPQRNLPGPLNAAPP